MPIQGAINSSILLPSPLPPPKLHPDSQHTSLLSTWEDKKKKKNHRFPSGMYLLWFFVLLIVSKRIGSPGGRRGRMLRWVSQGVLALAPVPVLLPLGEASGSRRRGPGSPTAQI